MQLIQCKRGQHPLRKSHPIHKAHTGSTLVMTVVIAAVLIGMMGAGIYLGLQAYLQNEIQKATSASALVGASAMYKSEGASAPVDTGKGISTANQAFGIIKASSPALQSFELNGSASGGGEDAIIVNATAKLPTPFLKVVGINEISMTAASKARAVAFEPTDYQGMAMASEKGSGQAYLVKLDQPLADHDGNDLYVSQTRLTRRYYLDACNDNTCFPLTSGLNPYGASSRVISGNLVQGSFFVDTKASDVMKASQIRIVHPRNYWAFDEDGTHYLDVQGTPVQIQKVKIYNNASLCPSTVDCNLPKGFTKPTEL